MDESALECLKEDSVVILKFLIDLTMRLAVAGASGLVWYIQMELLGTYAYPFFNRYLRCVAAIPRFLTIEQLMLSDIFFAGPQVETALRLVPDSNLDLPCDRPACTQLISVALIHSTPLEKKGYKHLCST